MACGEHRVENSQIHENVYGPTLFESNGNLIERNTIEENINWGLWFSDSSGNTVVHNNVISNEPQVKVDFGGNA